MDVLLLAAAVITAGQIKKFDPTVEVIGEGGAMSGYALRIVHDKSVLERVRLDGLDAPDTMQNCKAPDRYVACGRKSLTQLEALVAAEIVRCTGHRTTDGWLRARCYVNGEDVGLRMLSQGHAVTTPGASKEYLTAEDAARRAKRGLWATEFTPPAEYRKRLSQPIAG